jgi:hypothetical protein
VTAVAVVSAVESTAWKEALHPAEERLMPHMHSHDDLRPASVEPEVPFADQQPDNDAPLEVVEMVHRLDRTTGSAPDHRFWLCWRALARVSCKDP